MALEIIRTEVCPIVYWDDLSFEQQSEFDYLDTDERQQEAQFAVYQDWTYDLGEFMSPGPNSPFERKWHGYSNDSFFSGVLVRFADDNETVTLATFIA